VIDLWDMAVLRLTLAPSQHHSLVGQEHGRTIPLPAVQQSDELQPSALQLWPIDISFTMTPRMAYRGNVSRRAER